MRTIIAWVRVLGLLIIAGGVVSEKLAGINGNFVAGFMGLLIFWGASTAAAKKTWKSEGASESGPDSDQKRD
jgi:hypothetical protein